MPNWGTVNGQPVNDVQAPPAPPPLETLGSDNTTLRVRRHRMQTEGGK